MQTATLPTFTAGHVYEVRFTFKRLRELKKLGVDLTDETKVANLVLLCFEVESLAESLWYLVQDQVTDHGVTQNEFFE